jgi:predicted oxidoreductase
LRSVVRQPIVINQIPMGLANHRAIAGTLYQYRTDVTEGTRIIDYCRREGISLQAYSALRGVLAPAADAPENLKRTSQLLHELARSRGTNASAIALAWLLRHPANIIPIIGTANPQHVKENCEAVKVSLGRKEWYELLASVAT